MNGPNPEFIKGLFGDISKTYDTANDLITFGMARGWRKKLVNLSEAKKGMAILDCATGTGDLAIEFKKTVGSEGKVIGSDFCKEMVDLAPAKAQKQNLDIQFEIADATQLQYEDNSFDVTSIAYGIRNVCDTQKALLEMARVTKPGGYVMILETGETRAPVLSQAINIYFKHLVPRLGGWISGNKNAYSYLNQSSDKFPCREEFIQLVLQTGAFEYCTYTSLMGGASFIYKAKVPASH